MKYVIFLLAAFGFSASYTHAEGPCKADREKLCAGVEPGEGRIAGCMRENKDQLSAECKAHRETMKTAFKEVKAACHDDVEKLCSDVKPGKGAIRKCLHDKKDQLSTTCQAEVAEMKSKRKAARQ